MHSHHGNQRWATGDTLPGAYLIDFMCLAVSAGHLMTLLQRRPHVTLCAVPAELGALLSLQRLSCSKLRKLPDRHVFALQEMRSGHAALHCSARLRTGCCRSSSG